ncbi:CdaR family protein [Candidatus Arthromitus sp. SFB-rat-Yit]|uniref:CdaR family protein n=1 Tax=Candidatus Arthromitus sp. SFB-rat-Yit TaxID=1041504 RepID=UPI000227A783|nr:CdaR family protein [Candidatus Arthromitus sp. SFB-rat-Yit]BAK81743.1 membrane associated protein [Candidatus Arthromitus sp. SFB-rat-Yit]
MDKGKNKKQTQGIIVKISCFVIAFVSWVYVVISLNPVLTTRVYNIPVNVINSLSIKKNGIIVLPNQKFTVNLNVEGKANDIYNLKPDNFEIFLDLSVYDLQKGENVVRGYIRSIPPNISITRPNDLDIKIQIDEFIEKKVPIDKIINNVNVDGFYSFEPVINPEYVTVSGAAKYVNEVNRAIVSASFNDLKKDTYQSLKIKFLDKDGKEINQFLDLSTEVVDMYIMVKALKDVEIEVPFVDNLPEGLKLESVEVIPRVLKIIGTEDVITNIYKISSESVNLSKITENSIIEVPIKIANGIETVENKNSVIIKVKVSKIEQQN